jgi:hypothetical protein
VKRKLGLLLLLSACLILTGCMDVQIRFVVHADGSGVETWHVEIKPDAAAMGLNAASFKEEMLKNPALRRPGVEITDGKAPNGNQTITMVAPFQDAAQISDASSQVTFAKLPDGKKCSLRLNLGGLANGMAMVHITLDVEMPGKITASNADQIAGNVAHFTSFPRAEALYVESETSMFGWGNVGVIAGLAGLVVALAALWLRRGNQAVPAIRYVSANRTQAVADACGQCGTPTRSRSRFCRKCGMALAQSVPR